MNMKHVRQFEARNFKDWKKYNNYLSKKYSDNEGFSSGSRNTEVSIFSEYNKITISIKYDYIVSNVAILKLCKDFENLDFKLFPSSSRGSKAIAFEVYDVPIEFLDQIDIEMNAKKYNI